MPTTSTTTDTLRVQADPGVPRRRALDAGMRLRVIAGASAVMWGLGLAKALTARWWAPEIPALVARYVAPEDFPRLVAVGSAMSAAGLIVSAVVAWVARRPGMQRQQLVDLGLAFGVAVSWALSWTQAQIPLTTSSVSGFSWTAVWVLFFPLVVPGRPRRVAVAVILAVLGQPAMTLLAARIAMPTPPANLFLVSVLPTVVAGLLGLVSVTVMHNLEEQMLAAERMARRLGSYHLEKRLGEGGMGEVWRATHELLQRPAALKIIRPDRLDHDPHAALARFEREARAMASLQSPHTVQLFDFGPTTDGRLYYVMELLDGVDLGALVERWGPVPAERAVHLLLQACESLEEAHARGLVHRDVKPANVQACRYGIDHDFVKVLDFGLVASLGDASPHLTAPGMVHGTPAYMAPEVALGEEIDARADLYGLGCVAYFLLTGRLVFERANAMQMVLAHVNEAPDLALLGAEGPVPAGLKDLVAQLLSKRPADRPASAGALAEGLQGVRLDHPWTRERAARWWNTHLPGDAPATLLRGLA